MLIIAGRCSKLSGYSVESGEFFTKLVEEVDQFHLAILVLGLGLLVLLLLVRRFAPKLPAALVVVIVGILVVFVRRVPLQTSGEEPMLAERVAMRKIREVLRPHYACGLRQRKIRPLVGIGPTAVGDYLRRAEEACQGWPLPHDRLAHKAHRIELKGDSMRKHNAKIMEQP